MYKFPEGFLWGASSSGVQSEGITNKCNQSIWEYWYDQNPELFYNQLSNKVACDTYNRYKEDVKLMKEINFNSYRTSIQWSRLIKDYETNEVDQDAVDFYRAYFKEMNDNGIKPIMNLYHFDMPAKLQLEYGGFESKIVVDKYVEYAKICFELFGDLVSMWTTFNEPIVCAEGGYFYKFHYPAVENSKLGIQVGYNMLLAHAKVVKMFKEEGFSGEIGTVLNITPVYSRSEEANDKLASSYCDAIFNRSFIDPIAKGSFNPLFVEILKDNDLVPKYTAEEVEIILNNKPDFLGLNYYVPRRVKARDEVLVSKEWKPEMHFENYLDPNGRFNPHRDNNEIYPVAVYDIAKDIQDNYGNMKWYLAEIGISMTNEDAMMEGKVVNDKFRTDLFIEHMVQLHRAISEGSNCFGVHQWTFIDNWSWLNSHKRRYGFYYLDLQTRNRYMKKHALWFAELAKNNFFEINE